MMCPARVLVIGVGNRYRSDDAAGLLVADRLRELRPSSVTVVAGIADGASLIELWEGYPSVYIVDAVVSGNRPGKIYRFDAESGTIPRSFFNPCSTHSFSVAEAVQLGFALDKLPPALIVFGIEAAVFDQGESVSEEVADAVRIVAERIVRETTGERERPVPR